MAEALDPRTTEPVGIAAPFAAPATVTWTSTRTAA
jgi:hypothetical protein